MKSEDGWVKLWRKTLNWRWFTNPKVSHFFHYCLLKASRKKCKAVLGNQTVRLKSGQFIFGRRKAAEETGLSEQEIRTCLKVCICEKALKSTNHSTKQFSIITICKWKHYQSENEASNQPSNQPPTNLQPTSNQPLSGDKLRRNRELQQAESAGQPTSQPATADSAQLPVEKATNLFSLPSPDNVSLSDSEISTSNHIQEVKKKKQKKKKITKIAPSRKKPASKPPPIKWSPRDLWEHITDEHRTQWAEAYPACNLDTQLARMTAWLKANPKKARKSNWQRFIVNWLRTSQDRGGDTTSARAGQDARAQIERIRNAET